MSDNEEEADAAKDVPSDDAKGVRLDGVRPYEVARLAIELRKIPGNENDDWGDLSFFAVCLLELANEQLVERAQLPFKQLFNEPLHNFRSKWQRTLDLYEEIGSRVEWRKRSDSPRVPFAKVAKQITHSQRRKQSIYNLERFLSFFSGGWLRSSVPDYVRESFEVWLQEAFVPKEQVELLSKLYPAFQKYFRSALAKIKGQKGGLATAAKSRSKAQRR